MRIVLDWKNGFDPDLGKMDDVDKDVNQKVEELS